MSNSELDELRQSVKKEITQQTARWGIVASISLVTIAATGWWLYIKPKLVSLTGGVPSNVVVAFDAPGNCPEGWVEFEDAAGRAIIGSGKGKDLTERDYRAKGGEEQHQLTIEEIPAHTHQVIQMVADNNIDGVDSYTTHSSEHHNEPRKSEPAGGNQSHNNMPPFIALKYCKKIVLP